MDQMTKGQRVAVKTQETDQKGQPIPPRFFGSVVEVNDGGESGYVDIELTAAQREELATRLPAHGKRAEQAAEALMKRKFFHASELEPG